MARKKGFRRPERTIVVEFDESTDWHGAEVVCRRDVSIAQLRTFERAAEAGLEGQEEAIREFGDTVLRSWNLEENDGAPVPATGASLLAWPIDFTEVLIVNWIKGAIGVSAPLVDGSANGER